jgi:aminoglycoside phosphotransferase (APT) family kinase protein
MDEAERAAWLMGLSPPAATLAWLVDALDASSVVEVSQMRGGSTAAMHRVTIIDRHDHERDVVLRRYVRPEILAETPDVAEVEARALQLAERLPVPTPALLALDPTGARADVPALAMTMLEGRPVWETRWRAKWVSQAVDAMIALHDLDASSAELPGTGHLRAEAIRPAAVDDRSCAVGAGGGAVPWPRADQRCQVRSP